MISFDITKALEGEGEREREIATLISKSDKKN